MHKCSTCSGNGKAPCPRCGGTGRIEGEICYYCHGEGRKECPACDGKGEIED